MPTSENLKWIKWVFRLIGALIILLGKTLLNLINMRTGTRVLFVCLVLLIVYMVSFLLTH